MWWNIMGYEDRQEDLFEDVMFKDFHLDPLDGIQRAKNLQLK